MKSIKRRITPLCLAVLLLANTGAAFAAGAEDYKEEVVYVKLDSDGAARDFYAVNIFTLAGGGVITDYGEYASVRNMTTQDAITRSGDKLTITTQADKLYYEGVMENAQLPWDISIGYYLNGKKMDPLLLPGGTGALEIRLRVSKNPDAAQDFYDSFALELSVTLDTEKCGNIRAPGATLANVGKEKRMTYTVLPGKGLEAVISADVKDFEMEGITANGVGLALDIEVDTGEVTQKVEELQDGVTRLKDGAGELQRGATDLYAGSDGLAAGSKQLRDGAGELYAGMGELEAGARELQAGLREMQTGAADIQTGLAALSGNSQALRTGSTNISTALARLKREMAGLEALLTQLQALCTGSGEAMAGITDLYNGISKLSADLSLLDTQALIDANNDAVTGLAAAEQAYSLDFSQVKGVLAANNTAWAGVKQAQNAISGATGLLAGVTKLKNDYKAIDDGIQALYAQLLDVDTGLAALTDGITELEAAYNDLQSGMDVNLKTYTAGVDAAAAGYEKLYAALYGTQGVSSGTDSLARGIGSAREASFALYEGAFSLNAGTAKLKGGLDELQSGALELQKGTRELYDKTADMDRDINARIDEMIADLSGTDIVLASFVSEKNAHVRSVQFVISADPVEKAEEAAPKEETGPEPTFFERFLALFQ